MQDNVFHYMALSSLMLKSNVCGIAVIHSKVDSSHHYGGNVWPNDLQDTCGFFVGHFGTVDENC